MVVKGGGETLKTGKFERSMVLKGILLTHPGSCRCVSRDFNGSRRDGSPPLAGSTNDLQLKSSIEISGIPGSGQDQYLLERSRSEKLFAGPNRFDASNC